MKEFEKLMRGAHGGRKRELSRQHYDEAAKFGIQDRAKIEELYTRACDLSTQEFTSIHSIFRRLLEEATGPRPVDPCKRLRTEAMYGNPHRWAAPKPGVGPTKRTRTQTLQEELAKRERYLKMRELAEESQRTGIPLPNELRFPHYREVMGLMAELRQTDDEDSESTASTSTSIPDEQEKPAQRDVETDKEPATSAQSACRDKGLIEDWTRVAIRPDLYSTPERKPRRSSQPNRDNHKSASVKPKAPEQGNKPIAGQDTIAPADAAPAQCMASHSNEIPVMTEKAPASASPPAAPVMPPAPIAPKPTPLAPPQTQAVRRPSPSTQASAPRAPAPAPPPLVPNLPAAPSATQVPLAPVASRPAVEVDRNAETVVQPDIPLSHQHTPTQRLPESQPLTLEDAASKAGLDIDRQRDISGAVAADPQVSAGRAQAEQIARGATPPQAARATPQPPTPAGSSPGASNMAQVARARSADVGAIHSATRTTASEPPASPRLPDAPAAEAPSPVVTTDPITLPPIQPEEVSISAPNQAVAPSPLRQPFQASNENPTDAAPQSASTPDPASGSAPDSASLTERSASTNADRQAHRSALAAQVENGRVVSEEEHAAREAQLAPLAPCAQETFTDTAEEPRMRIQTGATSRRQQAEQAAAEGLAAQAQSFAAQASNRTQEAAAEHALGRSQSSSPAATHRAEVTAAENVAQTTLITGIHDLPPTHFAPPDGTAARMAETRGLIPPEAPPVPALAQPQPPVAPPPAAPDAVAQAQADIATTRATALDTPIPMPSFQAPAAPDAAGEDARRTQAIAEVEHALAAEMQTQVGPALEQAAAPARQEFAAQLDQAQTEVENHMAEVEAQVDQTQANIEAETPPLAQEQLDAQAHAQWDNYQIQAQQATAQAQGEVRTAETNAQRAHAYAEHGYRQSIAQADAVHRANGQAAQAIFNNNVNQAEAARQASQETARVQLDADQAQAEANARQQRAQVEAETQRSIDEAQSQHHAEIQAAEDQYDGERQAVERAHQAEVERVQGESDARSQQARDALTAESARLQAQGQAESDRLLSEGEAAYQREIDAGQAAADAERSRGETEASRRQAETERDRGQSILQQGIDVGGGMVSDLLNSAADLLRTVRDEVVNIIERARQAALETLRSFRERAQQALQMAMDAIQNAISAAADTVRQIIQDAADTITAAIEATAQALHTIVRTLTERINGLISALQTALNTALDGFIAVASMLNQEWGEALANATAGFRTAFNAAADQLQAHLQADSDYLHSSISDAAQVLVEAVERAAQSVQEAVTTIENDLHASVEMSRAAATAVIEAAFEAAETAVNAIFDAAEIAVTAWLDAQIAEIELIAVIIEEAAALAGELVASAIEVITEHYELLMSVLPDSVIEGFLDIWNSEWRSAIIIGLISLAVVAITVGSGGAAAPLGALILTGALVGGSLGGSAYFAGEMAARQGAQELDERNGDRGIYVPGQGYIDAASMIDSETGRLREDIPDDQRSQYQWALSNYHVNTDGTVEIKNDLEMFDYALSEGLEGAVIGAISGAAAAAGQTSGERAANMVKSWGRGKVTQVLASSTVSALIDFASSGGTTATTCFIESVEQGMPIGDAAVVALQTMRNQTFSPQAIVTSLLSIGFAGAQARYIDRFIESRISHRFLQHGATVTWDTVSGFLADAGGQFTGRLIVDLGNGVPLEQAIANAQQAAGEEFELENIATHASRSAFDRASDVYENRRRPGGTGSSSTSASASQTEAPTTSTSSGDPDTA